MAEVEGIVHSALTTVLRERRAELNTRFQQARAMNPALDAGAFLAYLRDMLPPVTEAVHAACPEKVEAVVLDLYAAGLEMVGQGLLGPKARQPELNAPWTRALASLPRLLAAAPRALAAHIFNGLHQLARHAPHNTDAWPALLAHAGCDAIDFALFDKLGAVAAWRCGLAHYRAAALTTLGTLPAESGWRALGGEGAPPSWFTSGTTPARLAQDPWINPLLDPGRQLRHRALHAVARLGGFRGCEGPFLQPPTVTAAAGRLFATDGDVSYGIHADIFGATLIRDSVDVFLTESPATGKPSFRVRNDDSVDWNGSRFQLDWPVLSSAACEDTLAVTSRFSHYVTILAPLPTEGE